MKTKKFAVLCMALVMGAMLPGCKEQNVSSSAGGDTTPGGNASGVQAESDLGNGTETDPVQTPEEMVVRFGDAGEPFTMHLYENDTAAAIARHVGTSDWRLPIYHYDDYEHWEVMQYYDIPSRYEIPSAPEQVTEEAAGTVYYSEPNRIILFYQDAEVSAEYTPVGYFEYTEEFLQAVQDNPVLEGWGNKIVQISNEE